jgi:hypothetical protein
MDVGKTGVPEHILNKTDRLTDDEFEQVKRHPVISWEMLRHLFRDEWCWAWPATTTSAGTARGTRTGWPARRSRTRRASWPSPTPWTPSPPRALSARPASGRTPWTRSSGAAAPATTLTWSTSSARPRTGCSSGRMTGRAGALVQWFRDQGLLRGPFLFVDYWANILGVRGHHPRRARARRAHRPALFRLGIDRPDLDAQASAPTSSSSWWDPSSSPSAPSAASDATASGFGAAAQPGRPRPARPLPPHPRPRRPRARPGRRPRPAASLRRPPGRHRPRPRRPRPLPRRRLQLPLLGRQQAALASLFGLLVIGIAAPLLSDHRASSSSPSSTGSPWVPAPGARPLRSCSGSGSPPPRRHPHPPGDLPGGRAPAVHPLRLVRLLLVPGRHLPALPPGRLVLRATTRPARAPPLHPQGPGHPYVREEDAPWWVEGETYWVWRYLLLSPAELNKFWERDWERVDLWIRADGPDAGQLEWVVTDLHYRELWVPYEKLDEPEALERQREKARDVIDGAGAGSGWWRWTPTSSSTPPCSAASPSSRTGAACPCAASATSSAPSGNASRTTTWKAPSP